MSDAPPSPPNMHHYACAIVGLCNALGITTTALVGHHTGASIALETAARYGDRISALVLVGILAFGGEAERAEWRHHLDGHMFSPDSYGAFLQTYPLPMLKADQAFSPDDPERYLLELVAYLQAGPRFWWAYNAVIDHDASSRFAQVNVPVLLINHVHSRIWASTKAAQTRLPKSKYVELVGSSEAAMDDPQPLAGVILDFFDILRQRRDAGDAGKK
jgi:pimeloyl-ACP methyl ester carboxylesterase